MGVTVLGPQRRPTLGQVVDPLDDGPLAAVTAGWQEREGEDEELLALLGGRGVNLGLYGRWLDVMERDREFATAEVEHRAVLDELQRLYAVQVDSALGAVYSVARLSSGRPRTRDTVFADAQEVVRTVDTQHLARVRSVHADFYGVWRPEERDVIAGHRDAVHRLLRSSVGLVVAGGHVDSLLRVLHLFNVAPFLPPAVVAWSAGAMALTERVVLFHDRVPHGHAYAEVLDEGLGLVRGTVLLPHARRRLHIGDRTRMAVLARRFAPAVCVVLDDGVRVDLGADGALPRGARVVGADGAIHEVGQP